MSPSSDDSVISRGSGGPSAAVTLSAGQRANVITCGVVTTLVVVVGLQWARPVLVPVALAILLTFLLNPAVKALHRRGVNQLLATAITVTIAGAVAFVFAWGIGRQVSGLVGELPRNKEKITAKIRAMKEWGSKSTSEEVAKMIDEITSEIQDSQGKRRTREDESEADSAKGNETIVMRSAPSGWFDITHYVGTAFETFAMLAFSFVLLVFFLIERADLRDRVVMLAGRAKMPMTSRALEDMTDRISRYVGVVAMINGGFGVVLTLGLLVIGVPYALLWGLVAATLRFIPYIGPWIGAIFPIAMSLATSDGWGQPISVLLFVTVVELVTNNAVEPLLFGHMTGVSPTALLISAAFWLYLWGPIGLVLSAPFAVCLVVLGKNIPQLSFLYLLLGDKPALNTHASFYQRLMLGDSHEAASIAVKQLKTADPVSVCDELFVPALKYAKRDHQRRFLSLNEQNEIVEGVQSSLKQVSRSMTDSKATVDKDVADEVAANTVFLPRVLCCPASDEIDTVLINIFETLADPRSWTYEVTSQDILCSELIHRIHKDPPHILLIASMAPGDLSKARYLCKRLRAASPHLQLLVMRCGASNRRKEIEELETAGATFVTLSLQETLKVLRARRVLVESAAPPAEAALATTAT